MASIVEEVVLVKISRVVKDSATAPTSCITDTLLKTTEEVVQELVGQNAVVEVITVSE